MMDHSDTIDNYVATRWIELPLPPSMNCYWRRTGNRTYLDKRALAFREAVLAADIPHFGGQRLCVKVVLHPRSKARCDLDNYLKPLLDALEHAGVMDDDEQVDQLEVRRGDVMPPGRLLVQISVSQPDQF